MGSEFIHEDFLLETPAARELYHRYAENLPILDYHCHLPPARIAADHRWENLAQIWLHGDHYKWRVMRANGVPERYCTGDATDWEKFEKWAETVPFLLRNPLHLWTHLELKRYFGISDCLLSPRTARRVWDEANARLARPEFSCRGLMRQSRVALVCTTDDPADSLEHHRAIAADGSFPIRVLPAWRPDKGMTPEDPEAFNAWLDRLGAAADTEIRDLDAYRAALRKRHEFFHDMGCRLSDHGIETAYAEDYTEPDLRRCFAKVRGGRAPDPDEALRFKSAMLFEFGVMDAQRGWTQQYHFGALRNVNTRMFRQLGPDTGYDAIGDAGIARPLARLLDRLDQAGALPRTVVYNLNPRDNALLVALLSSFQDGPAPGKMQFGSAWWFLDHKEGIERQLRDLSQIGLLSRFVGMLTDSRSFLSYPRHEYFRRVLCNLLGRDMAGGLIPDDVEAVGRMVQDISYHNAARYFGFDLPGAGGA